MSATARQPCLAFRSGVRIGVALSSAVSARNVRHSFLLPRSTSTFLDQPFVHKHVECYSKTEHGQVCLDQVSFEQWGVIRADCVSVNCWIQYLFTSRRDAR